MEAALDGCDGAMARGVRDGEHYRNDVRDVKGGMRREKGKTANGMTPGWG